MVEEGRRPSRRGFTASGSSTEKGIQGLRDPPHHDAHALRHASEEATDSRQRPRFDYLVNNAGVGIHASFAETIEAQFDELMNVHFKETFFLTQRLLPLIADGRRILNVSSQRIEVSGGQSL